MDNREIDALVAVHLFGWRWMAYPAPNNPTETWLTLLAPPDAPGRIVVANGYDRIWRPSTPDAPRFAEWDKSNWWEPGDSQSRRGFPYYSSDIAAAWPVVERFRSEQWCVQLDCQGEEMVWTFHLSDESDKVYEFAITDFAPLSICLAALRAVGVEID